MIEDESNKLKDDFLKEYYTRTIEYDRVLEGNLLLWTEYLDNCLKDYVIRFNFNFLKSLIDFMNSFHSHINMTLVKRNVGFTGHFYIQQEH